MIRGSGDCVSFSLATWLFGLGQKLKHIGVGVWVVLFVVAWSAKSTAAVADETSENEPAARPFNEVLADVIDEFSYDIKTNQVPLRANLSVRKISVSENIPTNYEKYLETMLGERVRRFSQVKVIHCTTCRVKQTVVKDGRVHVVSPINSKRALDQLAREYGIEAWLDAGLVYQESSLVLAINLFDARTKELLWSQVYNSETLYKRFPNGVPDPESDRKDAPEAQQGPAAVYIFGMALGWALVPNVNEATSMLAVPLRFAEVFNRKRSEAGAQVFALIDTDTLLGKAPTNSTVDVASSDQVEKPDKKKILKSFEYGLGLFGTYHHNFRTGEDDLDSIRPGFQCGLGLVVAANYLSFTAKAGINLRMGHKLFIDVEGLYSAPSTIELAEGYQFKTQGGVGALASFGIQL